MANEIPDPKVQGQSADRFAEPTDHEDPPRLPFPVVGLGASAGGLETLTLGQAKMDELESTTDVLTSLLSSTDIAVVFLDTHFRIRRFTSAVEDLMELIASDIGRPLNDLKLKFVDPDFVKDAHTVIERLAPLEREVVSETGRAYVRRILPYRTTDNRIAGVVITFVDISRRREAESALRENEERHRLILNGVKEYAILMIDGQGRMASWPQGAERIFGYTLAEAIGQPLALLCTPEDRAAGVAEAEIAQARAEGSASEDRWHMKKDGTRFWGSGVLSSLRDERGRIPGFVKVLRDNTDRKLAEDALLHAKNLAESANAAKDHFVATVSHELRTPLAAMMLWTKLLDDRGAASDPARLQEGLAAIRNCVEEQQELIEDLLDTSRIVAGKLRLEFKATDLLATVRSAVDAIRPTASSKNIFIEEKLSSEIGFVRADAHRLQQVVWNLLSNAVKFTPADGRIRVELVRRGEKVEITVADTGQGIAAEFLPHMFERFTQAEDGSTRVASGLGLGLRISKQLVELHGGTISARSEGAGKGAEFQVSLPLQAGDPTTIKTASNSPFRPKTSLEGERVMVLGDKAATRLALAMVLREAGADVVAFEGAKQALAAIKENPPTFILSDLGMPVVNGFEFIGAVRARERLQNLGPIPAIAFSAYTDENNRTRALSSGYQKCLTKPLDPKELLAELAKLKTSRV
jgi:two-component system CheB/CheR fusion protein